MGDERLTVVDEPDPARWFAGSPIGVGVFDARCRFVYVNDVLAALNGRPAAAHVGQEPSALLGPAADLWMQMVSAVAATGEALGPLRLTQESWGTQAFEVSYYPIGPAAPSSAAPDERAPRVVALVRDVTPVVEDERRHQALAAVAGGLSTATSAAEVADAVASGVVGLLADGAAVGLVDPTALAGRGGVRIAALRGYPSEQQERWTGWVVPLGTGTTVAEAAVSGEPVVVIGDAEILRRYPERIAERAATALLGVPVVDGRGDVIAAIHLDWTEDHRAASPDVAAAQTLAQLTAAALIRVRQAFELERDRFRAALDAMIDNVAVGCAIRDARGEIVDFELEFLNKRSVDGAGRTAEQLTGARVLALWPGWRASGMFDRFVAVVETGEPFVSEELHYTDVVDGARIDGWWSLRVVRFGDGYLASSRDVTADVRARRELADARVEREADRAAVALLHRYALPLRLPNLPWVQCAGLHRAADTVPPIGGDWYDAFTLDDGRVGLIVGDVAGHGCRAAELMIETRQLLADATGAAVRDGTGDAASPAAALARVNEALRARVGRAYVTCIYLVADPATATLTVGCAGHPPPVLSDSSGWRLLDVRPGPPLGVRPDPDYVDTTHALARNAAVVLYTDGLVEHPRDDIDAGMERLVARLDGGSPAAPVPGGPVADALGAHGLCELAMAALTARPTDDVCVLAARFDLTMERTPERDGPCAASRATTSVGTSDAAARSDTRPRRAGVLRSSARPRRIAGAAG